MDSNFQELGTPKEMWQKAHRELNRFEKDPCMDHAFNLLVSIYHIRDYAKVQGIDISEMDSDPYFQLCRLACNKGKHLKLIGRTKKQADQHNFVTHGDLAYSGDEQYAVIADGERIPVRKLAGKVLNKWSKILNFD